MHWIVDVAIGFGSALMGLTLLVVTNHTRDGLLRLMSFSGGIAFTAIGAGTAITACRPAVQEAGRVLVEHMDAVIPAAAAALTSA